MRLGLILPDTDDPWRAYNLKLGFGEIASQAVRAGWEVETIGPWPGAHDATPPPMDGVGSVQLASTSPTVLTGPGPTSLTRSLYLGHLLWRHVRDGRYDVLLGPLAGGLLQPCLMSRALGEALTGTAIGLWGDLPTTARVRSDETLLTTIRPLVDDALERSCLALADLVFAPSEREVRRLRELTPNPPRPAVLASLPAPPRERRPPGRRPGRKPRELVFVGPGLDGYGVQRLLAWMDRAQAAPEETARVVFAGPWRDDAPGPSKDLLGVRATGWQAEFELLSTEDPGQVLQRLEATSGTALFLGPDTDDDVLLRQTLARGVPTLVVPDHRLAPATPPPVDAAVSPGLAALGGLVLREDHLTSSDWVPHLERLSRERRTPVLQTSALPRISVCLTHLDRPEALQRAVASIGRSAEVVVADVGSRKLAAAAVLETLEAEGCSVLRLGTMAQGAACDRAALAARGEVLTFLDDDNVYQAEGCSRLAAALVAGPFDVVVTNLALYDGVPGRGAPAAHLVFLGDPGSAGLFFNGFGDISLAIRRVDFLRAGGFGDYDGPGLDWAFLARARSRGLKIGVLQEPAVGYARDIETARLRWRKLDGESSRREVLERYGGAFDAALVARYAQATSSDILQV
ncbi:glycosyltransferase [Caulobacter sp. S45]|uniref:glycosyltransferase n=1 Tax=Caulobacter sp. S45 TaxID=1641861 RepID=UPI0015775708|nr:glycosyltransferase [Caulobacter sp. S45]